MRSGEDVYPRFIVMARQTDLNLGTILIDGPLRINLVKMA